MKRIPLYQLLALIAVVGLGLAAIRSGSTLAVISSFALTITVVCAAVLGALLRARPFGAWLGFALFGVVWIIICLHPFVDVLFSYATEIAEVIQPKPSAPGGFPPEFNPAQLPVYDSPGMNTNPEFAAHADMLRARQKRVEQSATVILLLNSLVMGLVGSIVGRVLEARYAAPRP